MASAAKTIKVSGTFSFVDEINRKNHRLGGIVFEVRATKHNNVVHYKRAVGRTNPDGSFSVVVDNSGSHIREESKIFIRFKTEAEYCKVDKPVFIGTEYEFDSERVNVGKKTELTINASVNVEGNDVGKAFQVLAMLRAGTFHVKELLKKDPQYVRCEYPGVTSGKSSYASYTWIHLDGTAYNGTTVLHEYGHCFEHMLGCNYLKLGKWPGFYHQFKEDLTIRYGKEKGLFTAFFEGFATVFETMTVYKYRNSMLSGIPGCNVTTPFMTYRGDNKKLICRNYFGELDYCLGEGDELAVIITLLSIMNKIEVKYGDTDYLFPFHADSNGRFLEVADDTLGFDIIVSIVRSFINSLSMDKFNDKFEAAAGHLAIIKKYRYFLMRTSISPNNFVQKSNPNGFYNVDFVPGGNVRNNKTATKQNKFTANVYSAGLDRKPDTKNLEGSTRIDLSKYGYKCEESACYVSVEGKCYYDGDYTGPYKSPTYLVNPGYENEKENNENQSGGSRHNGINVGFGRDGVKTGNGKTDNKFGNFKTDTYAPMGTGKGRSAIENYIANNDKVQGGVKDTKPEGVDPMGPVVRGLNKKK